MTEERVRPMDKLLYIVVAIAVPTALLLAVIIGLELRKLFGCIHLYRSPCRDIRFVNELLGLYVPGKKQRILQNPCLFPNEKMMQQSSTLLFFGGKGVMILTVESRTGHYSTPPTGAWTLWQGGKGHHLPNGFDKGWRYADVISRIMAENKITCPIVNHVVLSDDDARIDDLYSDNVFTGAQLVPYAKWFCRGRDLSPRNQKKLREAILAYQAKCMAEIEEAKEKAAAEKAKQSMDFFAGLLGDADEFADAPADEIADAPTDAPADAPAEPSNS